jgi:hypothetical protein
MIDSTVLRNDGDDAIPSLPSASAASWQAIIAGAFAATAASLVLLALGSGLGFASISPWPRAGLSGMTLAVTAAIWLILTQWLSAAVGGYLAGRLRTRWIGTHTHEVFFRDTANGFVTWAVASVLVAATVATGAVSSLGAAGHAVTEVAAQGAKGAATGAASTSNVYGIDRLLRPAGASANAGPAVGSASSDPKPEVAHIIANALSTGSFSDADKTYLAQLVAGRTGISPEDAQSRVNELTTSVMDAETKAKTAADAARKAAAQASIYLALSMVIGAFIASVSAALGGRLRDEHP